VKLPARTKVERLLQVNVATMAAMGTLLLGMGQMTVKSMLLSLMVVLAAATSVCLTDVLKWIQLDRNLANLAAILAVAFCLFDFFDSEGGHQLLAIANLLIYLQIVQLYQKKNDRIYGQLMVLSLAQVVVSAALNLGFQFGLLLVIYMFVAFSALALFFVHRETARFTPAVPDGGQEGPAASAARTVRRRQRTGPRVATLISCTSADLAQSVVGWPLAGRVLSMGVTTLVLTVVFFFGLPRVSNSVWRGPRDAAQNVVGFSQEVTLGTMSRTLQSDEEVMRVSFYDDQTGRPYMIQGGPYLRGAVLTNYVYRAGKGKWCQIRGTRSDESEKLSPLPLSPGLVRQEIVLRRRRDPNLFSVVPVGEIPETSGKVRLHPKTRQLIYVDPNAELQRQFRYSLGTSGLNHGEQVQIHPAGKYYDGDEMRSLTRFQPTQWPNLKRVADEVVRDAGVDENDVFEKAIALQTHFHTPGLYQYSLDLLDVERTAGMDPVEDFVANHRNGHCEYYASALVLMLRSQGIPARMIVGYRAGQYNSVGHYYQVREKEAHAWVEAFLYKGQVPEEIRRETNITVNGAWLRLDPTPASGPDDSANVVVGWWDYVLQWKHVTQLVWSDYVLGLNAQRQRKAVYQPITRRTSQAIRSLFSARAWGEWFKHLGGGRSGRRNGLLLLLAGLLLSLALCRLLRKWRFSPMRATRRLAGWLRMRRYATEMRRVQRVEFYARFESLLARHGMRRAPQQTQRELANQASCRLAELSGSSHAAALPGQIVDAFYQVRFGRLPLDPQQTAALEHALENLEKALKTESP